MEAVLGAAHREGTSDPLLRGITEAIPLYSEISLPKMSCKGKERLDKPWHHGVAGTLGF